MEPFKPRTKILLIVGASKITFSGNKRDAQIATLANGAEVKQISYQQHSDSKPKDTDLSK
jgi:hypothetical protein